MGMAYPRPYPLEPLLRASGMVVRDFGALAGVSRETVHRLCHRGLTVDQADRFAVALGFHPAEVWCTWIDDHLSFLDRCFVEEGGWRDDWLQREAS